jgi:hypothetical protein
LTGASYTACSSASQQITRTRSTFTMLRLVLSRRQ